MNRVGSELLAEMPFGLDGASEDDEAAGFLVETMDRSHGA
jgi:hypothetical protein